jgi:CRISPR system Cascade subunit CasC
MFIEIHAIQNFAPSNLNRDDTGSPKDCEFGGHRRARVSSQCWKRAIREYFSQEELIPASQTGVRTKKLVGKIAELLMERDNTRTLEDASGVAAAAVGDLGVKFDPKSKDEKKTSVLLFVGMDQIEALTSSCHEHWDPLLAESKKKKKEGKKEEEGPGKKKKSALPKSVLDSLWVALQGSRAADLALFGRMIAEDPGLNVDAACQVAHALSTHRVAPEFDYYTAVDDLGSEEETGAGMIGTQEFNSACFYRYANIDLKQLQSNLQDDRELALGGARAFLQSFILAIPKAKQNSTAAQNLPSFVMIVVRNRGLASLANAFVVPIKGDQRGLMVNSVEALASYWGKLKEMYGTNGIKSANYVTIEDASLVALGDPTMNVQDLLTKAMADLGGA